MSSRNRFSTSEKMDIKKGLDPMILVGLREEFLLDYKIP